VSEQQLPLSLSEDAAEEFTAALGQVLAGGLRLAEWGKDNGIPEALGLSKAEWAQKKLRGHLQWDDDDERRLVSKHLTEVLGLSYRRAADIMGVSHVTVWNDLHPVQKLTAEPEAPPKEAPEPVQELTAPPESVPPSEPEAWLVEPCAECGKPTRRRWLHDRDEFGGRLLCDDCAEALDQATVAPPHVHVGENSGENEWYTPAAYVEAARAVMGDIDLDPASNAVANDVVGASVFYDADRNGLAHEWFGRVWMNPPYAQPACAHFCQKLVAHFEADTVTEACVLVNNATETEWFQGVAQRAVAVCFPNGRIRFWHPEREEGAPLQGQAVLYLGPHPTAFRHQFGRFGVVLERADA